MIVNLNFLSEYDKNLLLLCVDHHISSVHPFIFSGSDEAERREISLLNSVKNKILSSDFSFSKNEFILFDQVTMFFTDELSKGNVTSIQDEDEIDRLRSIFISLGRKLENFYF